ncbi:uncharacterized protein F4812DRAFT_458189 [Daldinia caldariorum]|uniref:uncharacterized protein n=1 Tax=Daldinia caldariorum TaxID=326644 RepID=UPI002008B7EC|nr:uncharacterized protein F4812DRAFT_458189 [Daldinia caldariorum]KAI1468662.1 hypothetical protein F4812DRAFT_458189 [Daldinia caldariorum]
MQKQKHKPKSSRPWSEPKWHDQYQQWYSERVSRHGSIEYNWIGPTLPNAADQSIPRSDAINNLVDNLAVEVGHLTVDPGIYDQGQYSDYSSHHATAIDHSSYTHDARQPQDSNYIDHVQKQRQGDKGKGKSLEVEQIVDYGSSSVDGNQPQVARGVQLTMSDYRQGTHPQYTGSDYLSVETAVSGIALNVSEQQVNGYDDSEETRGFDDDEYQEAIRRSRSETYGAPKTGEPSYSTPVAEPATSSSWSTSVDPSSYELNPSLITGEELPTPRGGSPVSGPMIPSALSYANYIQGTPGMEEILDSRYRVEHSTRFQPGEVFKILWSEPLGQIGGDDPISDVTKRKTAAGKFYVGFRRFIIVTTDESHHSTCVPILTYDRRGCLKKGVRPSKHGIIYTAGSKPRLLKNEPELGFTPVALQVYAEGEKLAKESRVNYSKLVTIEHNVKVFFIGSITGEDFENVSYAVDVCWNNKMRLSSKKSRR